MWLKVKLGRPSNQWYAYFVKCNVYISVYLHICSGQFLCNNKTHTHTYIIYIYIYIIHLHYTYTFYIYILHLHYTYTLYIIHHTLYIYIYIYMCWRIWMIAYKYTVYSFNLYIHAKLRTHIYIYIYIRDVIYIWWYREHMDALLNIIDFLHFLNWDVEQRLCGFQASTV